VANKSLCTGVRTFQERKIGPTEHTCVVHVICTIPILCTFVARVNGGPIVKKQKKTKSPSYDDVS